MFVGLNLGTNLVITFVAMSETMAFRKKALEANFLS